MIKDQPVPHSRKNIVYPLHTRLEGQADLVAKYQFDDDFTDEDQLWTPDYQEQPPQIALRARLFLNQMFVSDKRTYISITGHGGIIGGLLRAIGHRGAVVETGSLIPVIVRYL